MTRACSRRATIPATASTPDTTAAPSARRMKACTSSSLPSRRASWTRKTAAMYAPEATNSAPMTIEVTLSQLDQGGPEPAAGTRPQAMPPTTVPRHNGVMTEEIANSAPNVRRPARLVTMWRKAKPLPRRTMPSAAMESGM